MQALNQMTLPLPMGEGWGEGYFLNEIISFRAWIVLFELSDSIRLLSRSIVVSSFFKIKLRSVSISFSITLALTCPLLASKAYKIAKYLLSKFVTSFWKYFISSKFFYKGLRKSMKIFRSILLVLF